MLKTTEVYAVRVTLNDGQEWLCNLLSKPDPLTLAAVAAALDAPVEFSQAVRCLEDSDIAVPGVGERPLETPISIANTHIGMVRVETQPAYGSPARRPR